MNELLLTLREDWDIIGPVLYVLVPACFYVFGLLEGKKGRYLFLIGLLTHLAGMVLRWHTIGLPPLTEKHDNVSFMAFVMAIVFYFVYYRYRLERLLLPGISLICLFLFVSITYRTLDTVSPFMKSPWFFLYILFFFIGYAFFGISALVGLIYIWEGLAEYEALQYKLAMTGWTAYTIGLVAGSIWFFVAYGMYWLWTSKELWTTITWFYFGVYLHSRYIKAFKGRLASVLGVIGFAIALFTYFGIGPGKIIQSPPTQF